MYMKNIKTVKIPVHYAVAKIIKENFIAESVLDVGGVGSLGSFLDCSVTDANIKNGIDGCNLPYEDNSFDVSCSIATLEHVNNQAKFLKESIRVAKKGIVHWFPYGKAAIEEEEFRKTLPNKHPSVVPSKQLIEGFMKLYPTFKLFEYISCQGHLLLLTILYPNLRIASVYDRAIEFGREMYGVILYGKLGNG